MDSQALPPQSDELVNFLDPSETVEQYAQAQAAEEDKELAALSTTPAWQRISAKMQADIDGLRTGDRVDTKGKSLAEIGEMFVVASAVAGHLQSYLDMVNNAVKAVAESERKRSTVKSK